MLVARLDREENLALFAKLCPRSRPWKQRHCQWTYHAKKRVELYMCKHCQETGQGCNPPGSDYRKVSLQLIIDEPPEPLYNQWIQWIFDPLVVQGLARLIYDQLQVSVASAQDEHVDVGPLSHSNDRGATGQLIRRSILSNHECANLQYIGKVADKHVTRPLKNKIFWAVRLWSVATACGVASSSRRA